MAKEQPRHLVKMVNQIVLNSAGSGCDEEVARSASEHIKKFWSPLMKQQIIKYLEQDGAGLSPVAASCIGRLKQ